MYVQTVHLAIGGKAQTKSLVTVHDMQRIIIAILAHFC